MARCPLSVSLLGPVVISQGSVVPREPLSFPQSPVISLEDGPNDLSRVFPAWHGHARKAPKVREKQGLGGEDRERRVRRESGEMGWEQAFRA